MSNLSDAAALSQTESSSASTQRNYCGAAYGFLRAIQNFYDTFTNYTVSEVDGSISLDVDPAKDAWDGALTGLSSSLRTQIKAAVDELNTNCGSL